MGSFSIENGCQFIYDSKTSLTIDEQQDFCNEMGMTLISATNWKNFESILGEALQSIVSNLKRISIAFPNAIFIE